MGGAGGGAPGGIPLPGGESGAGSWAGDTGACPVAPPPTRGAVGVSDGPAETAIRGEAYRSESPLNRLTKRPGTARFGA